MQREIIHTYNNEKLIDTMHRLGYEHQGFSVGYSDMSKLDGIQYLIYNKNLKINC